MISFQRLGQQGRLGNQMFQYAFLRTQARRLGVKFYCPYWAGDKLFNLNDRDERAGHLKGDIPFYKERASNKGYDSRILEIKDNTDIWGYFQTERYFDKSEVKKWFSFKKNKIKRVKEKYRLIDFSKSWGVHLRFGDKADNEKLKKIFYIPRVNFYKKALRFAGNNEIILVFSDDIASAKKYLGDVRLNLVYIKGNKDWEDLYLMTQCRNFICSGSTFSWWGAWLNNYSDKKIIVPKEGQFRPQAILRNSDYWPWEWIKIRALRPVLDNYLLLDFPKGVFEKVNWDSFLGKIGILLRTINPKLDKVIRWTKKN